MYKFVDTTESQEEQTLPSEALNFNGKYFEQEIPGYRTLYVSGREILSAEITDTETGTANGTRYQRKRYPPRTITVGYQLIAEDNQAFREAYNKLNALLNVEQANMIFADEPDKYYIGTFQTGGDVPTGTNAITAELEFYCPDPFKYSVEEYEVEPSADDGMTYVVDYKGTYRAFPILEATMNGDNGLIGFINDSKKILQFGDPDETDGENYKQSEQVANSNSYLDFDKDLKWSKWEDDTGAPNFLHNTSGTYGKYYINPYTGHSNLALADTGIADHPNLNGWNGAQKKLDIIDSNGKQGAKNVYCYVNSWFETGLMGQTGCQAIAFCDKNGKMICCQELYKTDASGNTAHINMWVGGNNPRCVKDITFEPAAWDSANPYNRARGHSDMYKNGDTIRFYWWGSYPEFRVPELKDVEVYTVKLYTAQWGYRNLSNQHITCNFFRGIGVRIDNVEKWRDVPNKFSKYNLFSADCSTGEVLLQGLPQPGLGAVGNDWEEFYLTPGVNQIQCVYSSWAEKPDFKLKYREVFL